MYALTCTRIIILHFVLGGAHPWPAYKQTLHCQQEYVKMHTVHMHVYSLKPVQCSQRLTLVFIYCE